MLELSEEEVKRLLELLPEDTRGSIDASLFFKLHALYVKTRLEEYDEG